MAHRLRTYRPTWLTEGPQGPPVDDYEYEFPREEGPPPFLRQGDGAATLRRTDGVYVVELDHGAMRYVWEKIEASARYDITHRAYAEPIPSVARRALRAMREAGRPMIAQAPRKGPRKDRRTKAGQRDQFRKQKGKR